MTSPLTLQDAREASGRGEKLPCRYGCDRYKPLDAEVSTGVLIHCEVCGQAGPIRADDEKAIADWNIQQVPPCI